MRLFAGRVRNNEVETAITEELAFMGKENIGGNDIYIQMEQTFITGYALCSEGKYEEADPYLETAYKLACQLPYEEGFKFRICTVWNFLSTLNFIDKGDLYIEYVENSFSNIENIMSCTMLVNVLSIILIYDISNVILLC